MSSGLSFGGLASGIDTASIIEQLMSLERVPLTNLKAKQSANAGRVTSINAVKDLITGLQTIAKGLTERAKMNAKSATTDTPSTSPTVLTASAGADAINGTFKVTVKQLATSTRVNSGTSLGKPIDANATLANAGLRYVPSYGTFRINGSEITVDETTTLNDLVADIDAIAGLNASLVADADGRPANRIKIEAEPGHSIQLGSLGDTSNALRLLNLSDAVITGNTVESSTNLGVTNVSASLDKSRLVTTIPGNTAATTNSGAAATAGVLNTSITVNGVTTTINQPELSNTAAQNATFIAQAINGNVSNTVRAEAQADGTITLTQKVAGATPKIEITNAGTDTGLVNGTTQNGTDPIAGTFKINGVEIGYKTTDSIANIMNRINASTAGVTAFYDPVQDRLRLTASQTGARTMTLEDTQGNFLAATGVLNASQTLGENAVFNIDAVNGGADLTSATNTVSDYIPGVTLTLKSESPTPVSVTVTQDTATTMKAVKDFVTQYNNVLQKIEDLTKYDPATKKASALTGDSGLRDMQRQLRQVVSGAAIGATGTYRTLSTIGISFGAVGSVAGSTNRLTLDEAKLSKALADSPQAVESLFSGFAATTGAPTGTNVTNVSGTPQVHQNGTYRITITNAATGAYDARFVSTGGQTLWSKSGTMTAGQETSDVIPGLKITAAASFTDGAEDTFAISVTNKGIGVTLNDYLASLTDRTGYFADRKTGDDAITKSFTDRIARMEDRLERKQASLQKKYTALETTLSKMQSQSSSLLSQLAGLAAN